jgi:uncharacterized protein YjbI with pentapeptide repeats
MEYEMVDENHYEIIKRGVSDWNNWRKRNTGVIPNLVKVSLSGAELIGADLGEADLSGADLSGVDLSGVDLIEANLIGANLIGANLFIANLSDADLTGADLTGADLTGADLSRANLSRADLEEAILTKAKLTYTNLGDAKLISANLSESCISGANLNNANLSEWIITGIECSHIFWKGKQLKFKEGEFEEAFTALENTIEIIPEPSHEELKRRISELESALILKPWITESISELYNNVPTIWYETYITDGVIEYSYPILITGETGTYRQTVAEAVHNKSQNKAIPFLTINCSAFPQKLTEQYFFGIGAELPEISIGTFEGFFRYASGGTIFIDEINNLSLTAQTKLTRILERKKVLDKVRLITGSEVNLKTKVQVGEFREDLFYILNVIPINIVPLRQRKQDMPYFIDYYLKKERNKYLKDMKKVTRDALNSMIEYTWPGNLAELQNSIQYSIAKSVGNLIHPDDLPEGVQNTELRPIKRGPAKKLEKDAVRLALERTGFNKARTAKVLGVGRATLYRFLNEHPDLIGR